MLPADAVVIDETVSSGMGLRRFLKSDDAQSFFGLRGGGIGWGLPAAIGAKLALPERPVVALIGDGSALYTIQGLWTAAHEKLSMVFVIINNSSYRILKQRTNAMKALAAQTDRYVGMDLDNPRVDFVAVARGFGPDRASRDAVVGGARHAGSGAARRRADADRCRSRSFVEAGVILLRLCLAAVLAAAIAAPAAFASGCDLDELVGYQLVAKKSVEGYLDDAGHERSGYQGCTIGRVLVFSDHTGVRCLTSGLDEGLMPPAYLFARHRDDLKLCIGDNLFKVTPVR